MKTKKTYSNVFKEVINKIRYCANQAENAILHSAYGNPLEGDTWDAKFCREIFHRYVPEELIEQAKLDHKYAEEQLHAWMMLMQSYDRPRCYLDKIGIGELVQHCIKKITKLELEACQKRLTEDYAHIISIYNMEESNKKIVLSVNWRLQKLFPDDKVIKQAANNHLYQKFILGDDQISFIAQNYMDLVRHGWVYK